MKNLLQKLWRWVCYIIWAILILSSISILFSWGGIITALLSLGFWAMVLPVVYQNIKEKSHGIIPKISSSKFLGIYSVAVFIWYIVCFSLSSTTMPVKEMNVTYRENTSFTSAEMLDIQINQQNIENISINGESINIEWETFTYSFPLTMGSNSINIVWTSWSFEEKFTKNIERISAEQVEARKEEERQKAKL